MPRRAFPSVNCSWMRVPAFAELNARCAAQDRLRPRGDHEVFGLGLVAPHDQPTALGELAGEESVLATAQAEGRVEAQPEPADGPQVEEQVARRRPPAARCPSAWRSSERSRCEQPRIDVLVEDRDHATHHRVGPVLAPDLDQRGEPSLPGDLVVVDEGDQIAIHALIQDPVAGGGDARCGLDDVAHRKVPRRRPRRGQSLRGRCRRPARPTAMPRSSHSAMRDGSVRSSASRSPGLRLRRYADRRRDHVVRFRSPGHPPHPMAVARLDSDAGSSYREPLRPVCGAGSRIVFVLGVDVGRDSGEFDRRPRRSASRIRGEDRVSIVHGRLAWSWSTTPRPGFCSATW